jgi:hypothetical protein
VSNLTQTNASILAKSVIQQGMQEMQKLEEQSDN